MFEGQVEVLKNRSTKEQFQPSWDQESNPTLRKQVMDRFQTIVRKQGSFVDGCSILPIFHGTKREAIKSIIENGFAPLQSTDEGYFGTFSFFFFFFSNCNRTNFVEGKGLYFTPSPDYASIYCRDSVMIMGWAAVGNVFPVIKSDMEKLMGKSNYKNYDTHYAPVKPIDPSDPRCVVFLPIERVIIPFFPFFLQFLSDCFFSFCF
jgi:hypothetical protein